MHLLRRRDLVGALFWTFEAPASLTVAAEASAIAYVVNGHEFIVNSFGGNAADRESCPPNPVGDAIVAFALP